ncbi:MAG: hypothetical protein Q7S74_05605 [Nanoarchaeota archaeon]|nr:hypothetical protein [Nanoarchaeota archaeon]
MMEGDIKQILIDNSKEYYKNALDAKKRSEYNTAVTLFFKTLSSLADLYILINEGKIPSSHTERFRILELNYHEIYEILDKDFPFYQDSYRNKLDKETCEVLEEDVKRLFDKVKIKV